MTEILKNEVREELVKIEASFSEEEILKRSNIRIENNRLCFSFYLFLFLFLFSFISYFKLRVRVIV